MKVWVVVGTIDYEGSNRVWVCESKEVAEAIVAEHKSGRWPYDDYEITQQEVLKKREKDAE